MDAIIKDSYLNSKRSRLKALKFIYFKGAPSRSTERLPRIRVCDANAPDSEPARVSAFVGWRFPFPIDAVEMDAVKKWLKDHDRMLKLGVSEAIDICFRIFSRYQERANKYLYCGYPSASPTTQAETTPQTVVHSSSNVVVAGTEDVVREPREDVMREQLNMEAPGADLNSRLKRLAYAEEVMAVAKNDNFYRSLKLAVNPSCPVQFDVLCSAWMTSCNDGKPSENWCGLEKEIFEYCRLTSRGETNTSRYRRLKQQLSDDLEVFKLVRRSADLPLYE